MLRPKKESSVFKVILGSLLKLVAFAVLLEGIHYRMYPHKPEYEWLNIIEKWDYFMFVACGIMFIDLARRQTPAKKELPEDIYLKK